MIGRTLRVIRLGVLILFLFIVPALGPTAIDALSKDKTTLDLTIVARSLQLDNPVYLPLLARRTSLQCGWLAETVPPPNVAGYRIGLGEITALADDELWIAGSKGQQAVVWHWRREEWTSSPALDQTEWHGLVAVSPNDVWAVGASFNPTAPYKPLTYHWDGLEWRIVPSPSSGIGDHVLTAIAAVSATDIWAVGTAYGADRYQTLIEHWDGRQWTLVPSPNVTGRDNAFSAVAAVTASDIWAVGTAYLGGVGDSERMLIQHWDGVDWRIVPSPTIDASSRLIGLAAVAADNVWAVGSYYDRQQGADRTLILHWDGSSWTVVPSPNVGIRDNTLRQMTVAENDIWAVGFYVEEQQDFPSVAYSKTLVLHWNGLQWSIVRSPNPSPWSNSFEGVAKVAGKHTWVTGGYFPPFALYALPLLVRYTDTPCP